MKKLATLATLLISSNCLATELHNFDEVKAAVMAGNAIHITVDFNKCSTPYANMGEFTPDSVMIGDQTVSASLTHFTMNNPDPKYTNKPIYEFVTYTLGNDNNLNLTTQILPAPNFSPASDKFTTTCKLGTAARIFD